MQATTKSKLWTVLPVVIAAASLGVAGYQQFAIWRLERQLTAMLINAPVSVDSDVDERIRKLEAKLNRLASSHSAQSAAAMAPQEAAPEAADAKAAEADAPSSPIADDTVGERRSSVPERLATREGRTQWLAELAEATELTPAQTGALDTILSDEARERSELLGRLSHDEPIAVRLKELTRLRKESDRRAQSVLDANHFKIYQAYRLGVAPAAAL